MVAYSSEQTLTLQLINLVASSLSVLGSLFIILLYWAALDLRVYAFKLVMLLSIGDLVKCIVLILTSSPTGFPESICVIEGFLMDASNLTTFTWYLAISFTLYETIVIRRENIEKHYHFWLLLAYIIMPLLQIPPFITNSYGTVQGLCTLKQDEFGNIWRLVCVYIPMWVHILLTVYLYCKIYFEIVAKNNSFLGSLEGKRLVLRTLRYPIILVVSSTPFSILRLLQAFTDWDLFWLEAFALGLFGLQGLANAVAYGWNESVRIYLCQRYLRGSKRLFHDSELISQG